MPIPPTTGAQDLVAALVGVLNGYRIANPTLLRRVWSERPGSFGEVPLAYVDIGPEDVLHTSGTRQRTFAPMIVIVDAFGDNEQTSGRLTVLRDGILDAISASRVTLPNNVASRLRIEQPSDIVQPSRDGREVYYRSFIFNFSDYTLMEGRP